MPTVCFIVAIVSVLIIFALYYIFIDKMIVRFILFIVCTILEFRILWTMKNILKKN